MGAMLAAGLLGLSSRSEAIVRRADKTDAEYRTLATQPQFSSVGIVEAIFRGETSYSGLGSATLISSDMILSAAHVFASDVTSEVTAMRFVLNGVPYPISLGNLDSIHLHPDYDATRLLNDIAVVDLSISSAATPAALFGDPVPLGSPITLVGYGETGTGTTGSTVYDEVKRAAQNAIDEISRNETFEIDFDHPRLSTYSSMGSKSPLTLEGLLGPGDSGGSAWFNSSFGWAVVGINSYGIDWDPRSPTDGYGDVSGFTYVPAFVDWISTFGNVKIIPEPSVSVLMLSATVFFIANRSQLRRKRVTPSE